MQDFWKRLLFLSWLGMLALPGPARADEPLFLVLFSGEQAESRGWLALDDYLRELSGQSFMEYFCDELKDEISERTNLAAGPCGVLGAQVPVERTQLRSATVYLPELGVPLWPGPDSPAVVVFVSNLKVGFVDVPRSQTYVNTSGEYSTMYALAPRYRVSVEGSFAVWDNTTGEIVRARRFVHRWRGPDPALATDPEPWALDDVAFQVLRRTPYYVR
ncbi:MAG: hypothetical protein QGG40_01325 [Myxococcota bacterium]|nr:hypothetical protein [Myxococcota bacterium]